MSYLSDLLGNAYKENMTEEEISKALETVDMSSNGEIVKLKTALSKANSEAAEYKKKLREKQTDEEAAKLAKDEEYKKLEQENADLKRSINLAEKKAKLLGMGYDEKLAEETATAMIDNDMDAVLKNQSIYLEVQRKNIEADHLRKTPRPKEGDDVGDNSNLDYDKLISAAQVEGNYEAIAYYTRLQEAERLENKEG